MAAAGEGYALVPALGVLRQGWSCGRWPGAATWELRAGRPARDVLSMGTLAALDALRKVSASRPKTAWQASGATRPPRSRRHTPERKGPVMRLRTPATIAAVVMLAFGAAACGDDEDSSSGSASQSQSQAQPDPVAQIDQLTGRTTAVTLDGGFVEALTSLKLTPAPVGDAKITKAGVASFPISGGNVTYYEPGSVSPYVQGSIDHTGGLSLTGGGKTVELTDFVIDPGASVLTGTVSVDGEVAAAERAAVLPRRPHAQPARGQRGQRHRRARGHDGRAQGRGR